MTWGLPHQKLKLTFLSFKNSPNNHQTIYPSNFNPIQPEILKTRLMHGLI